MYIFEQLEHDSNQRTEATAPAKTLSMGSGRGVAASDNNPTRANELISWTNY